MTRIDVWLWSVRVYKSLPPPSRAATFASMETRLNPPTT